MILMCPIFRLLINTFIAVKKLMFGTKAQHAFWTTPNALLIKWG